MIPLLVMSREVGGLTTKCLKRCHFSMPAYDAGLLRFADTSLVEQGPECPSRKRQPYVPQAPLDHSKKSEGRQGFNGPVPTIGGAPFGGARVLREIPTLGGAPFGGARFLREEPRSAGNGLACPEPEELATGGPCSGPS